MLLLGQAVGELIWQHEGYWVTLIREVSEK